GQLSLTPKTRHDLLRAELLRQDRLDRDQAVQQVVVGLPHLAHTAAPQSGEQTVAAPQHVLLGHRRLLTRVVWNKPPSGVATGGRTFTHEQPRGTYRA